MAAGDAFTVVDPAWIELSDGCRLAARLWLPADGRPAPAILEAVPYRRRDGTLTGDHPRYAWWAARGFAGVRVDLRGSGDSDGVLEDEYLAREQDDDLEVLAWIAAQPWCTGRVGMIGYSWGGFAGLQVAARRPPELGAVVTVNSTVRRYTDDCHYLGGSVNGEDLLSWATTMLAYDARPPDPAVVGERWRALWEQRLAVAPPMIERWLAHQHEDAYWRHGSVAFGYDAVACPVLAVGGWGDPYRNAVLDLVEHLPGPRFGLLGPWAHGYPHATEPGPQIGFLQECGRFFGRYLRGDANGYDDEPRLRAYLQEYDRPRPYHARRSGRWLAVPGWVDCQLAFAEDPPIGSGPAAVATLPLGAGRLRAVQTCGAAAGNWCPYGGPSQPGDQRPDDALSLVFDGPPLAEPLEVLGFPTVRLTLAADRPQALVAVRLCDVAPTGESLLVTRGVLDLTHREGHDRSVPLVPHEAVEVELRLDAAGHRFAPGHRVRVAVSPSYWPWAWPSPAPVTLSLSGGTLALPRLGEHTAWEPPPAADGPEVEVAWLEATPMRQLLVHDVTGGRLELRSQPDYLAGVQRIAELDLEVESRGENVYAIAADDPLSAEVRCTRVEGLRRDGWDVRVEADARMWCTATAFLVDTELRAFEDGREVAARRFETRVPRADA